MVRNSSSSSLSFNVDLSKILQWEYKYKMLFNPDASKQVRKTVFSSKNNPSNHSDIYFNSMPLNRKNTQKHAGLNLDARLNFSEHINKKIKKAVKGISAMKRLKVTLPPFPINNL